MNARNSRDPESIVRDIHRKTRRKFSAEEKIRIVLEGLKGEVSISELCRREGIAAFRSIVFPGADHGMRIAALTGGRKLAQGYFDSLLTWVEQTVR